MSGLGWVAESYYDVLGTPFYVRSQTSELALAADRLAAPFRRSRCGVPGRRRYSLVASTPQSPHLAGLYRDCSVLFRNESPQRVLGVLVGDMNVAAIDCYRGFAVHAGVVTHQGRTWAFPGKSGEGKSTLVAACLLAGFDYVSDEALCVDYSSALVDPYPKALKLSPESLRLVGAKAAAGGDRPTIPGDEELDETQLVAADLGSTWAEGDLQLTDVVQLHRTDRSFGLHPLPPSQVIGLLLGGSFNHYKQPREAFDLVTRLARSCRAWRLDYSNPVAAAELLMEASVPAQQAPSSRS